MFSVSVLLDFPVEGAERTWSRFARVADLASARTGRAQTEQEILFHDDQVRPPAYATEMRLFAKGWGF